MKNDSFARASGKGSLKPGDKLYALPDAHAGHLPHQVAHLLELAEKLRDLVRLDAAAGRNAPPPVYVNHVGVAPLLLRHGVDYALDAAEGVLGVFALGDYVAHARHGRHDFLYRPHLLQLLELLSEVVECEVGGLCELTRRTIGIHSGLNRCAAKCCGLEPDKRSAMGTRSVPAWLGRRYAKPPATNRATVWTSFGCT